MTEALVTAGLMKVDRRGDAHGGGMGDCRGD
jgi:hypothetical protein